MLASLRFCTSRWFINRLLGREGTRPLLTKCPGFFFVFSEIDGIHCGERAVDDSKKVTPGQVVALVILSDCRFRGRQGGSKLKIQKAHRSFEGGFHRLSN